MQSAIEFAPIEAAGAAEARPRNLRLLPSVDSTALAMYFNSLQAKDGIVVLPLAPPQSLSSRIRRLQPDLVVIVSSNPTGAPWRNDHLLHEALSTVNTILFTPAVDGAARQLAAGLNIASVVPQALEHHQLVAALRAAATGLTVTLPSRTADAPESRNPTDKDFRDIPLVEHLTPREKAVLDRMARGCGNKEIAKQLDISEHTAKFHVSSVLAKLGAASRTEAVTIGILNGLVAV